MWEEVVCVICQGQINGGEVYHLECNHAFHVPSHVPALNEPGREHDQPRGRVRHFPYVQYPIRQRDEETKSEHFSHGEADVTCITRNFFY